MTIDPKILGFEYPRVNRPYDARDTILYALGVGAGRRGDELRFVYEEGCRRSRPSRWRRRSAR